MGDERKSSRLGILTVITSPLGFFVLALLIAETTLGVILIKSDLDPSKKFYGLLCGVGMFAYVVTLVALLVWYKAQNLTFDREAHLIDRGRIPYGSEAHELKAKELESPSNKAITKRGEERHA